MSNAVLRCEEVRKSYIDGSRVVEVLRGVDLELTAGENIAIIGASGSGKSTLLNLLAGLDLVTDGRVLLAGQDLATLSEAKLARWRNANLGFVYQFHHLLPEFDALENVAMPQLIGGVGRRQALEKAASLLSRVGLEDRLTHRPGQLSGGERQRVAIARSLINEPRCVLMDEPTGNLDPDAAAQVLELMETLRENDSAFVVVTHDVSVAQRMGRVLELRGGRLEPVRDP